MVRTKQKLLAFSNSVELNNILNTTDMQTAYETKLHHMNWDPTAKVELEVEIITNLKVLREELQVSQRNLEMEIGRSISGPSLA